VAGVRAETFRWHARTGEQGDVLAVDEEPLPTEPEVQMLDRNATQPARNEAFAWKLIDAAPDGVIVVEDGGRIVLANRFAERLFGYARGELLSHTVEELVPEPLRQAHVAHRTEYGGDPLSRPMGGSRRLQGRRRDGTTIPVEINLSPVYKDRSRIVIATIRCAHNPVSSEHETGRSRRGDEVDDRVVRRAHEIALLLRRPGAIDRASIVDKLDDIIRSITTAAYQCRRDQAAHSDDSDPEATRPKLLRAR
jgi:PAS domain S-box-containing protein